MLKIVQLRIEPRKLLTAFALLLAVPLSAATFTTIEPPSLGEGSTVAAVEAFCPSCVRVSDEEDIFFSSANGFWVLAFEDFQGNQSDHDFNDLVVWAQFDSGSVIDWGVVASYTAATSSFGFDGLNVFDAASGVPGVATSWSNPALNLDGLDHVVSWFRPELEPLPRHVRSAGACLVAYVGGWACSGTAVSISISLNPSVEIPMTCTLS